MITDAQFWGALGLAVLALIGWARERWRSRQPAAVESANIAAVALARDELAEDNAAYRQALDAERRGRTADRVQADTERASWWTERQQLVREIDRLEERLRIVQRAYSDEIGDLLDELAQLRTQHRLPAPLVVDDPPA